MPVDKNGKIYNKCGKMISRKSNLNPHIVINISKALETESLEMSLDCCNCDLKSGIETGLRVHLIMKHGKLNLVGSSS